MGGLVNLSVDVEALEVLADGAAIAGVASCSSLRKRGDERGGVDILNKRLMHGHNKLRCYLLLIVPSKRH